MTRDLTAAHLYPERPASQRVNESERWLDARRADELFAAGTSGARDATLRNSYGRAVAAAFQRDDAASAFRLLQKYDTDAITTARSKQLMRAQLTRKKDRKDLTTLQDLYEDHTAALHQSFLSTSAGDLARVAILSETIAALDVQISSLAQKLKPALVADQTSGIIALADIIPTLGDTDALITIASTPYGLHVALVTSDGIHLQTHDIAATQPVINDAVTALKNPPSLTTDMAPFDVLGQLIFNEDLLTHLAGRKNLSVISRGAMAQIPLSVARIKRGEPGATTDQWAVERFAFNHLTSLTDLLDTPSSKARSIDHFIGVGFSQSPPKQSPLEIAPIETSPPKSSLQTGLVQIGSMDYAYRSAGDLQRLKNLPGLPRAGAELRAISQSFSPKTSDILADRIFSEKDVRALDLTNATVLSFASHGLLPGELDTLDEAALVIAPTFASAQSDNDGLLSASEISDFKLSAEWVVLSACNSGAGNAETGEALSGLATAFTYAGAKSLLVSHWPVRDDAAAFLTVNTVKYHHAGMSKAQALQRAMNDLRNHEGIPDAQHPAIWAPFILVGQ
jgi:CHAT domain-containing protein